jgi:cytochrome P450
LPFLSGSLTLSDVLNALPYLDMVIREICRMGLASPEGDRCATHDTVIPLKNPLVGADGSLIESINVPKGTHIHMTYYLINMSKEIWGPDADKFNPERFANPNLPLQPIDGVYKLLSFGGGAHNCM